MLSRAEEICKVRCFCNYLYSVQALFDYLQSLRVLIFIFVKSCFKQCFFLPAFSNVELLSNLFKSKSCLITEVLLHTHNDTQIIDPIMGLFRYVLTPLCEPLI